MSVEFPMRNHSAGRCLAAIPSLSSAEAAQATTTARVKTGESPRRLVRVTMRRGPWRRTSASAMTRLTGGIRSSAGLAARIGTMPFLGSFGEYDPSRALPRNGGTIAVSFHPSVYDPSGQTGIWQYPCQTMCDIEDVVGSNRLQF